MIRLILYLSFGCLLTYCNGRTTRQAKPSAIVGGGCEGCEAIYENTVPFEMLNSVDTLPDFSDKGEKIGINGVVYQRDGRTPAKDVIIYIYHTNQAGIYPKNGNEKGWAKRHGYIRGWMKTNEKGEYAFYTLRPASYPNSSNPQHIHITIKEPGRNEYWIDDYQFLDDPMLTAELKQKQQNRGGSGFIQLQNTGGISSARRDIILGLNIENYPQD